PLFYATFIITHKAPQPGQGVPKLGDRVLRYNALNVREVLIHFRLPGMLALTERASSSNVSFLST
ncbi:hypothetical protein, partial [Paenibacillus sp. NPDC057934]|uniref:hypothetical protein n=1 Tax=Paenibacillus sp. NPDC057934 TaxID=3346282 RepID=UPI0036DF5975